MLYIRFSALPDSPVIPDTGAPLWLLLIIFAILTILFIFYGLSDHCDCGGGNPLPLPNYEQDVHIPM